MSREQELLGAAAITAFRLNGQFLDLAEHLARPAGITAAWWQVLGAVIRDPLPVSAIAREMGITRQAVQRTADVLVDRGLAEYRDNPAHRRAKLVAPTPAGRDAIAALDRELHDESNRRNPGATADLTGAAICVVLLEGGWSRGGGRGGRGEADGRA
jgi:DNA-binding MarR family transcriptional regulator